MDNDTESMRSSWEVFRDRILLNNGYTDEASLRSAEMIFYCGGAAGLSLVGEIIDRYESEEGLDHIEALLEEIKSFADNLPHK